ncbi:GTP pyrophosphokinase family protein [Intrasporangium sp.]|uniref:GTP pyrophosphokinase n=1 Tax=Intrasporangium sp. TaxID=1925024 RepID=UPI0026481708|nr:GTP pyrophosphokinase [Intrasporangium sp.]
MTRAGSRERRAAVHRAATAYAERRPQLQVATRHFVDMVTDLLDDAGINYLTVTGRTKTVESYAGKAERIVRALARPDDLDALIREEITDAIGVRVVTYVLDDVDAVAELLAQELAVLDDRDLGVETARAGRFGYSSRHLLVAVDASRSLPAEYEPLRRLAASVQVRTVLQHAWAEFEHDIRYKGTVPEEYASDLDRRFTLAAGLLDLADREFAAIRHRLQVALPEQPAEDEDEEAVDAADAQEGHEPPTPRIGAQDLAKFLAATYTDAGWSRSDHYDWISGLLADLGIGRVEQLGQVLAGVDEARLSDRMEYKYPPGAVRRLDDALLAVYGADYLHLPGNAHRVPSLQARLARLESGGQ